MKKSVLYYFLLLFLFSTNSFGAVTMLIRNHNAAPGSQVTVPVKVKDFLNIISTQGTIQFDQTITSFVSVQDFGLTGLNASSFGTTQTSNGKLTFSWFDASLAGISLPDTTIIFSIKFNVIGTFGQVSVLSFVNAPVSMEIVNNAFNIESLILQNGFVNIQTLVTPANVTLVMDTISGTHGSQLQVSLRGIDFTNINSVQGTIQFDPAVVSYGGIGYYGLPGLSSSNFGTAQISSGKLNFSWLHATLTGQNMPDNTPLFSMIFNLIGNAGDQTTLSFSTSPTPLEVTDSLLNTLSVSSVNGKVSITGSPIVQTLKLRIDSVSGPNSSQVVVPVRAWEFIKVVSMQGTISFNTGVATFANVEQFGLTGMNSGNFGTSQVNTGKLMFSWSDATLLGETVSDSSVLFAIRYNVVGVPGDITPLDFINTPTPIEIIDTSFNLISSILESGRIRVSGVMSISTGNPALFNFCSGDSVSISFTSLGAFNAGNNFILQASDDLGSFTSPTIISTLVSTSSSGTFNSVIPFSLTSGIGYLFRVISTNPGITGTDNGTNIIVSQGPSAPSIPAGDTLLCENPTNSAYSISPVSAATSYNWTINPSGAGTLTPSGTTAIVDWNNTFTGSVQISVSASNGTCPSEDSPILTISINPIPTVISSSNTTICAGASTNLTASGATTYSWSPATGLSSANVGNPTATLFATTTYIITGTSLGCSDTAQTTVSVTPLPTIITSSSVTVCAGASTNLSASGATTYNWSPATGLNNITVANPIATPLSTTTYVVTGTENGCSDTASLVVAATPLPVISLTGASTLCSGTSTVLTASGATSYSWTPSTGLSNTTIPNPTANPISTETYTINGTTGSCTGSTTFTLTVSPPPVVTATGTATICAGASTPLSASGAATYNWSPATGLSSATIANPIASPSNTTTYIVTGANGTCTDTTQITITVTPVSSVSVSGSTTICNGGNTTLLASGATTYNWAPITGLSNAAIANPIASPTITTTYTVTGITGLCSDTAMIIVTVNPVPAVNVSANATICAGASTNLSASGATTYTWSPSTGLSSTIVANPTATPASTTTYVVTGISLGCSDTAQTTVTVTPLPTITTSGPVTICNGSSALLVTGGTSASYLWSPASGLSSTTSATPTANPSSTTTYTVTGTANSCSNTASLTVTVASLPVINVSGASVICNGSSTVLTASGANSYVWSPSTGLNSTIVANPTANPSSTTTYTVSGTTGSCTGSTTFTLTVASPPNVVVTGGATICSGTSTPLSASGATTYSWSPATGLSNATIANPSASPTTNTTYTVTGTTGSCTDTVQVTVTVTPVPSLSISGNDTICNGGNTLLTASGATTYSWSPATGLSATNIANPVASPTAPTTMYTVTGTTGTCSSFYTITITVKPSPTANAGNDVTIACGGNTTLNASGGSSYLWSPTTGLSNPTIANPVATPPYSIKYTVTVSNGSCTAMDSVLVTVGNLVANAGLDATICTGNSTTLNGTATGGSAAWVNLATSTTFAQSGGTYSAITGGTQWLNSASASMDDVISGAITIPAFKFNNITYTSLYISTNGFLTFGASAPTSTNYSPISSTETYTGAIAGFGVDFNKATTGTPEIRYQQVGSEFIIQWQDMGRYAAAGTLDRISFQIRLNTSTNQVKIVYAATSLLGSGTAYPQVGLRGSDNTFATNVINRSALSNTGAWINSVPGTSNLSTCYYSSVAPSTVPASGTTFTFTPVSGTTTYAWAPATGLSSVNIANPVATPTTTTTYTLTVTNGSCTSIDMVTVTVGGTGTNAGSDAAICSGNSVQLNATGEATYSWSPSTGLSAANIANPVANPTTTTTYTVTGTTGTCTTSDIIIVNVTTTPSANAGTDVSICSGGSTTLNASGGTTYSWAPATGLSSTTGANPIANPSTTTTYTVTVSNGTCSSTDMILVTVNPVPAANAGTDVTICAGNTISLTASGGTIYSWSPATGLSGTNIANPIANPIITTTYIVTVSNGSCSSTDNVVVTVNTPNANAGNDVTVCTGNSTNLVATGGGIYSWFPVTGLSDPNVANPVASPSTTTTYTVSVSNGACSVTDVVIITVLAPPIADAGLDTTICAGNSVILVATGGTTYAWAPIAGLSDPNIANPVANPTTTTTYLVDVSNGGCSSVDSVVVSVNPTPVADAGNDVAICSGNSTPLNALAGGINYNWFPATGLSNPSIANPVASPGSSIMYTVLVSAGACSAMDSILVIVNDSPTAIGAISGLVAVCDGSSQTYSVTNDPNINQYSWILPGGWMGTSVSNSILADVILNSGIITVTGTNACGNTVPENLSVTVNPLPTVTFASFGTVCVYATAFALATGSPSGGTYSGTAVSGGNTFTPGIAGSGTFLLNYVYSDFNGCSNSDTSSITVDLCTDVESTTNSTEISVYPNPFTSSTTIKIGDGISLNDASIKVFDIVGKEVFFSNNFKTKEVIFERKNLKSGIYFYQFICNGKTVHTGKLVIQ